MVDELVGTRFHADLFSLAIAQAKFPSNAIYEPLAFFLRHPPFSLNHFLPLIFCSDFAMFFANNLKRIVK